MSAGDLLRRLTERLDGSGIPYMIVGSLASTYYGQPRSTQDIDVVIDPTATSLRAFLGSLSAEDYYASEQAALDAFDGRGMFNVIDHATGWKIDLIILKRRPFSQEEFRRRTAARMLGQEVHIASAEDTILSKLEWAAQSASQRQERDVAGILDVKGESLDADYIERWAKVLGVDQVWRRLRQEQR